MIRLESADDFKKANWPDMMKSKVEGLWKERWQNKIAEGFVIVVLFSADEIDSEPFSKTKKENLKKELLLEQEFVKKNGGVAAVVFELESLERRKRLQKDRALLGISDASYNCHGDLRNSGNCEPHWSH